MSTAVSLTNSMAGGDIDIHVGDKIYPISPPTGENYDDLIALTKSLLYEKDFDSAYEILQKIPNNVPQAGHANLLKTLAILAGR
ncbi:MAG: hypothetical protein GY928_40045, partial [Colwellia sp.]|nr:hypothetical protein [Colwellia sp.]